MVSQLKNQELIQDNINNKFSSEVQLLLLASRKTLSESNINKVQVITSQVIDWQQVINLAKSHSVIPLVAHNLQKYCAKNLPDNIKTILKTEFRSNAIKNIYLSKELLEIVQLLKDNDIDYICYKGASLAASIYGDISFRQFNDIDILICKKDLLKARDLFFSMGGKDYFSINIFTDKQKEYYVNSKIAHYFFINCAYTFEFKKSTVFLDLHW
ncbi:nucleotidyltransferase family protein, partial [Geminocystis sp. GBBB08]|uniref:nucleotidyltransferase family protein n=1 Tax=Geminocystis sp. GBBB08 TaxID=2604140 RepID=UPI0027E38479